MGMCSGSPYRGTAPPSSSSSLRDSFTEQCCPLCCLPVRLTSVMCVHLCLCLCCAHGRACVCVCVCARLRTCVCLQAPPPPRYGNPELSVLPRTGARTVGFEDHNTIIGTIRGPFVSFSYLPVCPARSKPSPVQRTASSGRTAVQSSLLQSDSEHLWSAQCTVSLHLLFCSPRCGVDSHASPPPPAYQNPSL